MTFKNSWEELPKKGGTYFVIKNGENKAVFVFSRYGARWVDFDKPGTNGSIDQLVVHPDLNRFQWLDEDDE